MKIVIVVALLIAAYLFGCIESGYVVGKLQGLDIRDYGSGNAGTTNVLRVLGKRKALFTFLGDGLKGLIPVLLMKYLFGPMLGFDTEMIQVVSLLTGLAAVMGHDFPVFLKFKGGKGIATTGAVMMAFDWRMGCLSLLIFIVITAATRYVSLASITLSAALLIEIAVFYPGRWDLFGLVFIFTFFAIYRHKANIGRLLSGTENRLGQKVKVEQEEETEENK